ncbi:hypothetical protein SDC9_13658 [bioreactor metagenome]|uniref:Uncharacterized protein n=1 Tax=bioreactor metagenome TaxID=1076179 RepID=A0A644TM51_9ZZZZ
MKMKSRFHASVEGVTLGDQLIAATPDGTRFGIYVGACCVISVKSGIVSSETLEEFSSGLSLQIYLQKSDFAAAEIVRRAKSQIGALIEPWDDEYFCAWCRRGVLRLI